MTLGWVEGDKKSVPFQADLPFYGALSLVTVLNRYRANTEATGAMLAAGEYPCDSRRYVQPVGTWR